MCSRDIRFFWSLPDSRSYSGAKVTTEMGLVGELGRVGEDGGFSSQLRDMIGCATKGAILMNEENYMEAASTQHSSRTVISKQTRTPSLRSATPPQVMCRILSLHAACASTGGCVSSNPDGDPMPKPTLILHTTLSCRQVSSADTPSVPCCWLAAQQPSPPLYAWRPEQRRSRLLHRPYRTREGSAEE